MGEVDHVVGQHRARDLGAGRVDVQQARAGAVQGQHCGAVRGTWRRGGEGDRRAAREQVGAAGQVGEREVLGDATVLGLRDGRVPGHTRGHQAGGARRQQERKGPRARDAGTVADLRAEVGTGRDRPAEERVDRRVEIGRQRPGHEQRAAVVEGGHGGAGGRAQQHVQPAVRAAIGVQGHRVGEAVGEGRVAATAHHELAHLGQHVGGQRLGVGGDAHAARGQAVLQGATDDDAILPDVHLLHEGVVEQQQAAAIASDRQVECPLVLVTRQALLDQVRPQAGPVRRPRLEPQADATEGEYVEALALLRLAPDQGQRRIERRPRWLR